MSSLRRTILGNHYLDTGPLFCFGDSQKMFDLYHEHFIGKARVAKAVVSEVDRNADKVIPGSALHDRAATKKKQAAKNARGMFRGLFSKAKTRPPDDDLLASIKDSLDAWTSQREEGYRHEQKNAGELESIYWARKEPARFVTNDRGAHDAAKKHEVHSLDFVDVARYLARCQGEVSRDAIFKELQRVRKDDIDVGEDLSGLLDF